MGLIIHLEESIEEASSPFRRAFLNIRGISGFFNIQLSSFAIMEVKSLTFCT